MQMTPLMQRATESQRQVRLLRAMVDGAGPPTRRLGEPHPEVHQERLQTEMDMLAGLEEDGLVGAALIKAAAAAKEEYEMELRDLLEEATAAVDALREQIAPSAPKPPPAQPVVIAAAPAPPPPPPQPAVDDLLGLSVFAPAAPPPPQMPMASNSSNNTNPFGDLLPPQQPVMSSCLLYTSPSPRD